MESPGTGPGGRSTLTDYSVVEEVYLRMWGEHGKGPWGWPARGQSVDWKQIPQARSEGGLRNWRLCHGGRVAGWPKPTREEAWGLTPTAGAGQESSS